MINKKSWKEFKDSGLLWWINGLLHTFGWSIVFKEQDGEIIEVYPARVKFRGFSERINSKGHQDLAKYLKDNAAELEKEAKE